ncbi:MAG: AMP-binding protein [Gammaproteobacteria bacterium]|nr:AMP-binding protein [Gammaproteobacteria bacterium]
MRKTLIEELADSDLFPMTLMLEYRAGNLKTGLYESISNLLCDNLSKQHELVKEEPYRSIILNDRIKIADLEQWKNGSLIPPKRRIAVDKYIKASLAQLSQNKDLTKIHDLNHFVFLHRFEAYAKYYPNQPALLFKDQMLTYAQLNARANQMAYLLLEQKKVRGLDPGQEFIVGTFLPREPQWIIAILAIWKAGGAFIAIDPTAIGNSPDAIDDYFDKFAQTLADGKPAFILTHSDHQYLLPKPDKHGFFCLCLDDCEEAIKLFPTENTTIKIDPEDLAYILYTSGSSGKPKGVEIAHRGFMPCLEAHRECVDLTRDSIMAQYATCDFDAWVAETLILGIGGTLAIVPSEIRLDEKRCAQYYRDHKINVVIFTPAFLNKLGGPENFPLWKALFIVGESFDWELVKKWKTDQLQIVNGYGLTETTICATLENLDMDEVGKPLSIGKAIVGTKILIKVPTNIDVNNPEIEKDYGTETTYQNPKSPLSVVDQAGEPWFGGISLTRRYRGDAMQNNAWRFEKIDDERYYKSGDRAILRADGRLEHQGRYSRMVKISGKRIELPSIEANLCEHFQLEKMHVAVTAVGNSLEDKNLTTLLVFLVEKEHQKLDDAVIRDFIINTEKNIDKQSPLHIIWKKDFPTTQTKINLVELNKSYFETHTQKTHDASSVDCKISSDENVILLKLQNCWKEVLCKTELSLEDDFFLIGGRSIDISPLIQVIRLAFPEIKEEINNALALECKTLLSQTKRLYSLLHPIELTDLKKKQNSDAPYIIFCPPSILGDPEQDYSEFFSQCDQDFKKSYFDERFQIYGLKARGLTDPSLMPTTLYSMAQDYALTIKYWIEKHNKKDIPIFVLGWSSGGTLSPEIVNALAKYNIPAYAYVCDSIAPFPFHHFTEEEHTRELILLAQKLSSAVGLKIDALALSTELIKVQKPRDRIINCFDYLIQRANEIHKNILKTAKIIRIAEHNYIIREHLPSFRLFKAKNYLLNGILDQDQAKTHYWPKKCIRDMDKLEDNIIDGDHFSIMKNPLLAKKIRSQIIFDYATNKLHLFEKMLSEKNDFILPNIKITSIDEYNEAQSLKKLSEVTSIFLHDSEKKALSILGDSGMGKTYSSERIYDTLVELGVPVAIIKLNQDISSDSLSQKISDKVEEFNKKSLCEISVLILEGLDEIKSKKEVNYYAIIEQLNKSNFLKSIFTLRTETSTMRYKDLNEDTQKIFEEIELQPFSDHQMNNLLKIKTKSEIIASHYYETIRRYPELYELCKNPLILEFIAKIFRKNPLILLSKEGSISRYKIYMELIDSYLKHQKNKLTYTKEGCVVTQPPYEERLRDKARKIALLMFKEGKTVHDYKPKESDQWDHLLNTFNGENELNTEKIREIKSLLLIKENNTYRFVHSSIQEFFVIEAIADQILSQENPKHLKKWFNSHGLYPAILLKNRSLVRFWLDVFKQEDRLNKCLFNIIDSTRGNKKLRKIGGIAITLLNSAQVKFIKNCFEKINISDAILDNGILFKVSFKGSILRNVSFKESYLYKSTFENASLKKIDFGEVPYIEIPENIAALKFSDNEYSLLIEGKDNNIYKLDVRTYDCPARVTSNERINSAPLSFSRFISACSGNGKIIAQVVNERYGEVRILKKSKKLTKSDSQTTFTIQQYIKIGTEIKSVALNHNGKLLATAGHGCRARLSNLSTAKITIIEPSQSEIYPSVLNSNFDHSTIKDRKNDKEKLPSFLEEKNIKYSDSEAIENHSIIFDESSAYLYDYKSKKVLKKIEYLTEFEKSQAKIQSIIESYTSEPMPGDNIDCSIPMTKDFRIQSIKISKSEEKCAILAEFYSAGMSIYIWNFKDNKFECIFTQADQFCSYVESSLFFSKNEHYLIFTDSYDSMTKICELTEPKELVSLEGGYPFMSKDETIIGTISYDTVILWEFNTFNHLQDIPTLIRPIFAYFEADDSAIVLKNHLKQFEKWQCKKNNWELNESSATTSTSLCLKNTNFESALKLSRINQNLIEQKSEKSRYAFFRNKNHRVNSLKNETSSHETMNPHQEYKY